MGMNMHGFREEDDEDARGGVRDPDLRSPTTASSPPAVRPSSPPLSPQQNSDDLETRLTTLADQLENVLAVSRSLQVQQCAVQATLQLLEAKVVALEDLVRKTNAAPSSTSPSTSPITPPPADAQPSTSSLILELLPSGSVASRSSGVLSVRNRQRNACNWTAPAMAGLRGQGGART